MATKARRNILIALPVLAIIAFCLVFLRGNKERTLPYPPNFNTECGCGIPVTGLTKENIIQSFPYHAFIGSGDYKNISCISKAVAAVDSITHDNQLTLQVFAAALTDSLEKKNWQPSIPYQPDSLIYLMLWAERFQDYAEVDSVNRSLYNMVYDHWMLFIANRLEKYSKDDKSLKYTKPFIYLWSNCDERQYVVAVKEFPIEKVVDNVIRSQWGHLFSSFINEASVMMKLGGVLLILFILLGVCKTLGFLYSLILLIFRSKTNRYEKNP